jgi:hypothetical protein
MPEKYEWPNTDGLYCKSYCPLHPDVHKIVFGLIDEICTVFETNEGIRCSYMSLPDWIECCFPGSGYG